MTKDFNKVENKKKKMKFKIKKISGSLIASLAFLTVGSISPVHASCENAPASGSQFKYEGPGSFKLRMTAQRFIKTKNPQRLNMILTRVDRRAQFDLGEFFKGVFNGEIDVDSNGEAEWLIGPEDMQQKEITEGFQKEVAKFNTKVDDFDIPGTRKVGQCVDPGNMIVVTRQLSSEQIFAALQGIDASNQLKGKSTDDVAENETIISEENKGPKGYKSQVSGGYDGYADMEEF